MPRNNHMPLERAIVFAVTPWLWPAAFVAALRG